LEAEIKWCEKKSSEEATFANPTGTSDHIDQCEWNCGITNSIDEL
jgi:hypothetical protein